MDFETAKVLVTGGSSGIGREVARVLVAKGARVVIAGRRRDRLEAAAKETGAIAVGADVADETAVRRLVEETVEKLGGFDTLINNAGYGYFAPLVETDTEEFQRLLGVNLTGAMLVGREAARHFVAQSYGHIVNVGSTASTSGFARGTAYVASKFALRGMTQCWQAELRKHNVRVTLVKPSEVITDFHHVAGLRHEGVERKLRPEDLAQAIVSTLALDDRGFVPEVAVWATNPWPPES